MTSLDKEEMLKTAAGLAARGDYDAAEAVLDKIGPGEATSAVDRLRAKIAAQQGQIDRAIGLWRRILEQEPEDAEARAALRLLDKMRNRRVADLYLRAKVYYAVLLAVIFVLLVAVVGLAWNARVHSKPVTGPDEEVSPDLQAQIAPLADAIQTLEALQAQSIRTMQGQIAALQQAIEASETNDSGESVDLIQHIEGLVTSHRQLEAAVREDVKAISKRVDSLAGAVAQLDGRLRDSHALWLEHAATDSAPGTSQEEWVRREMDALNQGMSLLIASTLSQEMRELAGAYRALERKFWWRSEEEKQAALAQLDRLRDAVGRLIRQLEQP